MHRRIPAAAAAALALCAAGGALAEPSPWFIGVSQQFTRDDNMLLLSDGQAAPAGYSRSDRISTTSLLAGFDQPFGRQRGYANVSVRANRYAENSIFDNVGYNGVVGLDWSTVNRISGTLVAAASRNLQRFGTPEVGFVAERNLETVESLAATLSKGLVTQYSLELAAGHRRVSESLQQPSVQASAFSQTDGSVGVRWRPSGASSFGLGLGMARGKFPKFRNVAASGAEPVYESDEYERRNVEFTSALQPTGDSSLDLRISQGKTTYDINRQRDFSGLTGSLGWSWRITGKTRMTTRYVRDTGQDSYATSYLGFVENDFVVQSTTLQQSRVVDLLQWQWAYDPTAKIGVFGQIGYYDRKLVQSTAVAGAAALEGRDKTTVYTLGLRWTPLRAATVGCDYNRQQRRGEGPLTSDLHGTSFGCFGQITLQ